MSIYEIRDLAILIAVVLAPTLVSAVVIAGLRPAWSTRKAILLSMQPVPGFIGNVFE